MAAVTDIVRKVWGLCDILRDDGVTFHQYVNELTYLLFLKMAAETGREDLLLPGCKWGNLIKLSSDPIAQKETYLNLLLKLGTKGKSDRVRNIFLNPTTFLRHAENLNKLISEIDALDWHSIAREGLGDVYEGILQKNASEKKSGAGQYFTPRPLINCIVNVLRPKAGELIVDPAAGTCGFLIIAKLFAEANRAKGSRKKTKFFGVELVRDTQRLALMNALLHELDGRIERGDTIGKNGVELPAADVIITNPPFGTKRGAGREMRQLPFPTSNKQLAFLQLIYESLKPGGRAAVVLPDNVLFEKGMGAQIRENLMDKCDLHTILRLPTGIFYAQGVKTNVLFFTRGKAKTGNTKKTWFYDLRTNIPAFGKRTPLTHGHFAEFEKCYGKKADGTSKRNEKTGGKKTCPAIYEDDTIYEGEDSRFRGFSRDFVRQRSNNLDISWLKDDTAGGSGCELAEPDEIAAMVRACLGEALAEMDAFAEILEPASLITSDVEGVGAEVRE